MGKMQERKQGKKSYYVYQETYRVKTNPDNSGKKKGSGKSMVKTKAIYLGSAEKILQCVEQTKEPISVMTRHFGVIAAAYQTALEISLQKILMKHIEGKRYGIARWIFFFVTIINRLDHSTSKNKMSHWLKKTILPDLLDFDPDKFTSKNFWYVTDDVISEKELIRRRETENDPDDIFVGLKDEVFNEIEMELFQHLDQLMGLSPSVICYDTTNFYTYIEEPKRSELANTCHSKDSKHHLRHVGLLMAVEKNHGIPLISRVYRANRHDSKVFSYILADLVIALKKLCGENSDLVIVLDKGNNSEENFQAMYKEIHWVGSLVPSNHQDLIDLELSEYQGTWRGEPYYRTKKELLNIECAVVVTFNSATKRKQEHSLMNGIEKLKTEILKKWHSYKKKLKEVPKGIETMLKESQYGACVKVFLREGFLQFELNEQEIYERKKRFGKSLIFSDMVDAESGFLIDNYRDKSSIEDNFQLLKETTIIRFRPMHHWTDTKIRAFAFCCVVSMTLMRVMQFKVEQAGYPMSAMLLKEELSDLQEVIMVYSPKEAKRKITQLSSVQERLWRIFNLMEIEKKLLLH
jgi:transposase